MIIKIDGRENNPENSSTTKKGQHILCGYLMSAIWTFDHIENKHTLYRGEDCKKKFCTSLKEHATNVINLEKKFTVNKRRPKITSRCKSIIYFCKKIPKKNC